MASRAKPLHAGEWLTPLPPAVLHVTMRMLAPGHTLHRVHQRRYRADEFNPGVNGNARFSPIQDDRGAAIPTLYGGSTMACALMESVFHDVPHTAGFKSFDRTKLADQAHSTLRLERELELADLSSIPLRKLGVTRKQLIDTEKTQYRATRTWAVAIHRGHPTIQGLYWVSRQDDSARAVVLFGDRIAGARCCRTTIPAVCSTIRVSTTPCSIWPSKSASISCKESTEKP